MSPTEDELIAEMAKAWRRTSISTHTTVMDSAGLRAALGAVEPLIRADERERMDELRAKVVALRSVPSTFDGMPIKPDPATIEAVLALIDGGE